MANKKAGKSKAIATVEDKSIEVYDYGEDAAEGFGDQSRDDLMIPFIVVLQPLSPQCKDRDGFPEARPGMLFNTVTEELFEELEFVPAMTQHVYVEWTPRSAGGGFVGLHDPKSQVVRDAKERSEKFGKYKTEDGNDLVETFYVYGTRVQNGEPQDNFLIAFTSTKISVYKRWNTRLSMFTVKTGDGKKQRPPMFAHRCKVGTVDQKNQHGEFWNFVLTSAGADMQASLLPPGDDRLEAAKSFRELIKSGQVRADYETAKATSEDDQDIPF